MNDWQEMLGQILSVLAMVFSILTFQMRTHKQMMVMQALCAGCFAVSYLFLGAYTGAVIQGVATVRNVVFYHRDKKLFSGNLWVAFFAVAMAVGGVVSWVNVLSLLPLVGMVVNTLSVSCTNPQRVRQIMLISSPMLLLYNIFTFSIGGIFCEVLSMISIVVGLIRTARQEKHT